MSNNTRGLILTTRLRPSTQLRPLQLSPLLQLRPLQQLQASSSQQRDEYFRWLHWRLVASWVEMTHIICLMAVRTRSLRVSVTRLSKWSTGFLLTTAPLTQRWRILHRLRCCDRLSNRNCYHTAVGAAGAGLCRVRRQCRVTSVSGVVTAVLTAVTRRQVSTAPSASMSGVAVAVVITVRTWWRGAWRTARCCLIVKSRSSCTTTRRHSRRHLTRRRCCRQWARTPVVTTAPTCHNTGSSYTPSSGTRDSNRYCAAGKPVRRPSTRRCYLRVFATPYRTSYSSPSFAACGKARCLNRRPATDRHSTRHTQVTMSLLIDCCF